MAKEPEQKAKPTAPVAPPVAAASFTVDPLDAPLKFKPYEPKPKGYWWVGTYPGGPQHVSTPSLGFNAYKEVKQYDTISGTRRMVAKMGEIVRLDDAEAEKVREHLGYEFIVEKTSQSTAHGVVTTFAQKTVRDAAGAHNRWMKDDEVMRGAKPIGAYVYMKRVNGPEDWPDFMTFLNLDSTKKNENRRTVKDEFEENGMVWARKDFFKMELFPSPVMVPEAVA